ncbi:MAG: TolC family protein [Candidatus Cloacimonetes bacterium]|jgi:outer membrane protein|nr:TolC family protein [Candidatus Cloacimonadota bacterium]MBT6994614.1 TolC family protein [Candidatus Cloacimonadota bacterium]MBT7468815.1 TolC family protein [Candidatus Cloacimonadota bacterium]
MKKMILICLVVSCVNLFLNADLLSEFIEIGLENSLDIQDANRNLKNEKSSLNSNYFNLLPSFSASLNSSKNFDDNDNFSNSASLQISKTFQLNEPNFYSIKTAIWNMKSAELSLQQNRKQIAFNIFSDYLMILETQENLQIQQENFKMQTKIFNFIKAQFEIGEKSKLEFQQSKIDLINYEIAITETKNHIHQLRNTFFSLLKIEDDNKLFSELQIDFNEIDIEFNTNLTLLQNQNNLKISELSLLQNKIDFLPSLSLSYSLAFNDENSVYEFENYQRNSNSISISASYNIFNLLGKRETYLRAKRDLRVRKLQYDNLLTNEKNKLQNLHNDLVTAQKTLVLYEQKLQLATENLQMAEKQFTFGNLGLIELDRIKIEHQNSQVTKNQKIYSLLKIRQSINLLLSRKILGKW